MKYWKAAAIGILTLSASRPAPAIELITPAEARPELQAQQSQSHRLILRGGILPYPDIQLVSPPEGQPSLNSPFRLNVKFAAHSGSQIDLTSFGATYLNNPSVDLTTRLRQFVSVTGIVLEQVEAPPGRHLIKIDISDNAGHSASKIIELRVNRR